MGNKYMNTDLLDRAILFAVKAHANTERRGKGFPYIVHPLEAVAIVATMTADQEMLAAAALHDTIEDTDVTYAQLEAEFGSRVARLVEFESDPQVDSSQERASWRERKQIGIDRLSKASRDEMIVAMGDKLSNMRAIARDYHEIGDALWNRFHAPNGKADIAWRYHALADAFKPLADTVAFAEFNYAVNDVFGPFEA